MTTQTDATPWLGQLLILKSTSKNKIIACLTVQESSAPSTVSADTKEDKPVKKSAPAKPKAAEKAPAKPLPEMMAEDVIPALKSILEAQEDISELELSFEDNRVRRRSKRILIVFLWIRGKYSRAIPHRREEDHCKACGVLGGEEIGSSRDHSCLEKLKLCAYNFRICVVISLMCLLFHDNNTI